MACPLWRPQRLRARVPAAGSSREASSAGEGTRTGVSRLLLECTAPLLTVHAHNVRVTTGQVPEFSLLRHLSGSVAAGFGLPPDRASDFAACSSALQGIQ